MQLQGVKIFNHQDNAQSNERRINQRNSDPDADFCETKAALHQELHWSLSKNYDMGELRTNFSAI